MTHNSFLPDGRSASSIFGPAEGGPVFLSEVECTGTEVNITQCPRMELTHTFSLENTAGVLCEKIGKEVVNA